jgi:hypothetical protein
MQTLADTRRRESRPSKFVYGIETKRNCENGSVPARSDRIYITCLVVCCDVFLKVAWANQNFTSDSSLKITVMTTDTLFTPILFYGNTIYILNL